MAHISYFAGLPVRYNQSILGGLTSATTARSIGDSRLLYSCPASQ